jgi:hypothetical protein
MPETVNVPSDAAKLTPIYSNYFTILVGPDVVRISFGEAFGSPDSANFHVAVALTPGNAKALADTILGVVAAHQSQIASSAGQADGS